MNDKDILQKEYLELFENMCIEEFEGYSLKQLLFNETYYVQQILPIDFVKKFILTCFTCKPLLECHLNEESDLLLFSECFYRNDHDVYWKQICDLFDKKSTITVKSYKTKKDLINNICLRDSLYKILLYKKICKKLCSIKNKLHRRYLALQLTQFKNFEKRLETLKIDPKVVMCFFDGGFYENLTMQYYKNRGAITITNQHGQPVFRTKEEDLLNQSQILNFKCDYFLAKGEYTKKQFLRAGVSENHIIMVGDLNKRTIDIDFDEHRCFCVFLDCPTLDFSEKTNRKMIDMANTLSEELGFRYFIKIHPQDKASKYDEWVNKNCIEILDKMFKIEQLRNRIDFGILHASAVYLDLLGMGIKSFCLKSQVKFPLVESNFDIFENISDIKEKYYFWASMSAERRRNYLQETQQIYIGDLECQTKILEFVQDLLDKKG